MGMETIGKSCGEEATRDISRMEWLMEKVFGVEWGEMNYEVFGRAETMGSDGSGFLINIPLTVVISLGATILVNLLWYWVERYFRGVREREIYEIGYGEGVKSKAVKLGRIKFGGKVGEENVYEVLLPEEEFKKEVFEGYERMRGM